MAGRRWSAYAFRVFFAAYASGVVCWLALGLLPTLATLTPVHDALEALAAGGGAVGRAAGRVIAPDAAAMAPVGVWLALLQYGFSLLNLALGLLLFVRRPDALVPRLLAIALLGTAATFNLPSHRAFHIIATPLPVVLLHFAVHILSGVAYLWAVVLFPDGRWPRLLPLGPRATRVVAVLVTAATAVVCWRSSFLAHPQFFVVFFGVVVALLGVGAQLLRIGDATLAPHDRAVARLLCGALAPSLVVALLWLGSRGLTAAGLDGPALLAERAQQLFPLTFAIVPIVLVTGVLRYRLWDVDRLLSRVLVYGIVTLGASACYVAGVTAASWLGGAALWSTMLALVLAATVVEPLRIAARRWANRVVFGQVLTPAEAMRTLLLGLEQLRAGTEVDELTHVALAATRARSADVWLREHGRLVRIAHAGVEGPSDPAGSSARWPIGYDGDDLGLLTLDVADGDRLGPADRAIAARISAHAGLVVHNAQLTVRLVARVAELAERSSRLQQARRRMVAAQDDERHRLERDLHDGAQQALVAAAIGAGSLQGSAPAAQRREAAEVLDIARAALDEVFQGARPAALVSGGLRGALQEAAVLAERSGLTVRVEVGGGSVADPEVEVAVYFCCVEALQNVVKHARARRADVTVEIGEEVSFAVVDDGRGLDEDALTDSTGGLLQLGARLSLLGGTLTVESPVRGGAAVRGNVPVRASSSTRGVPA